MIVDCHVHICEPPHDGTVLSRVNIDGSHVQWSGTRAEAAVDRLLEAMDSNGIEKSLIMGLEGIVSNEHLGEVVRRNRRLEGFAWVTDPKNPQSIGELEVAVRDHGLIGLKLHPSLHDFVPSQPEVFPLVRRAAELGVPTLIHCYPWPPGFYHHNLPRHIDVLRRNVPEAIIVIGHMGHLNFNDLLVLARTRGVYAESSWGLTLMAGLHGTGYAERFLCMMGVGNLLFGSDWFGPNGEMERQLDLISRLELTGEEREMILGGNASRIFGL